MIPGEKETGPVQNASRQALDAWLGFPESFIEATCDASLKSGAIISFRADHPPHLRHRMHVSPKPASLKIKTFSERQGIDMLTGFVPVDQITFGRTGTSVEDALESTRRVLMEHHQEEEATKFSRTPLEVTFDEIHTGSALGFYSLFATRDKTDWCEFKASAAANNEFVDPDRDRRELIFRIRNNGLIELDEFLAVEYCPFGGKQFVSLDIIAYEGYPVTGDVDMLAVATPLSAARMLGEELLQGFPSADLYKAYDVSDFYQLKELVVMYLLIRHAMNGKPISRKNIGDQEIRIIMESAAVKTSGVISPYELLVLMLCHEKLAQSYNAIAPGSENLIRHGAESNNPGKLADINTPMLHIMNGEVFVTHGEWELVNFYLQPGLLETRFLIVHPRWNMALWGDVIQKQLALGQESLIPADTLKNYHAWEAQNNLSNTSSGKQNTTRIMSSIGSPAPFRENEASANDPSPLLTEKRGEPSPPEKNDIVMPEDPYKKRPRLG